MTRIGPSRLGWRKSSRSQAGGTEYVEVAAASPSLAVCDSKDPDGAVRVMSLTAWPTLRAEINRGDHDLL
ncbi:DUF397 domain-containing protein [Actinomadura fibrosa]|uniref:DUF397 domain-containing protein n=1 Tax=Actinomadura fibrosa TaxID=111802 RepID=A0ABW2XEX2_9ACTN|nr:DUF397 domain-containing protein [Actinomadura fibrosa]